MAHGISLVRNKEHLHRQWNFVTIVVNTRSIVKPANIQNCPHSTSLKLSN